MIILDTNIISEIIRQKPELAVITWVEKQSSSMLYTTSITQSELLYGAEILPEGIRREQLIQILHGIITQEFFGKILPFGNPQYPRFL